MRGSVTAGLRTCSPSPWPAQSAAAWCVAARRTYSLWHVLGRSSGSFGTACCCPPPPNPVFFLARLPPPTSFPSPPPPAPPAALTPLPVDLDWLPHWRRRDVYPRLLLLRQRLLAAVVGRVCLAGCVWRHLLRARPVLPPPRGAAGGAAGARGVGEPARACDCGRHVHRRHLVGAGVCGGDGLTGNKSKLGQEGCGRGGGGGEWRGVCIRVRQDGMQGSGWGGAAMLQGPLASMERRRGARRHEPSPPRPRAHQSPPRPRHWQRRRCCQRCRRRRRLNRRGRRRRCRHRRRRRHRCPCGPAARHQCPPPASTRRHIRGTPLSFAP